RFWSHIRTTGLKTYTPRIWNVDEVDAAMRFSNEINAELTAPHPSLPSFVGIIQALRKGSANRTEVMSKSRAKKRQRRAPEPLDLPVPVELGGSVDTVTTNA
ncbi:hypothetical protein GN958_ATG16670, partial [Phytophthora infestans]